MPGGFPKPGLVDAQGRAILSRDDRFNAYYMSSRALFFYDNETHDDIFKISFMPSAPESSPTRWPISDQMTPITPVVPL